MMSFYESDTNDVFCMVHYAVVPEESSTTMFREQLSVVHWTMKAKKKKIQTENSNQIVSS